VPAPKVTVEDVSRDGPLARISERYAIPRRLSATLVPADDDAPLCRIVLTVEGGRPVVEAVALERRPNGPPLTSTALRSVPVGELARQIVDQCGYWILPGQDPPTLEMTTADGEIVTGSLPFEPFGEDHIAIPVGGIGLTEDYRAAARPPRESGRVTDETLRRVAAVYNEAIRAPTKAVRETMVVSPSTASRWVKRAKDAGLIPAGRDDVST
jgi:hypothetical protein